jgi:arginase
MGICLIQVPYMVGNELHPAAAGPEAVVHRAVPLLDRLGLAARTVVVQRPEPFRDSVHASRLVNIALARAVREAIASGGLPIALAGSCDASMGVVAGFPHDRAGVVWIDAHGDFNTPESTVSGFFGGMSLAVLTGECYREVWAQVGDATPIAEERVVLFGTRDLSPEAERERLERSAVEVVPPDVDAALDRLAARADAVYLHVDLDGLDPEIAPGIVDPPVPGGLTLGQLEGLIVGLAGRLPVAAASITTYVPEWDRDERTLEVVLRAVELIALSRRG